MGHKRVTAVAIATESKIGQAFKVVYATVEPPKVVGPKPKVVIVTTGNGESVFRAPVARHKAKIALRSLACD